MILAGSVGIAHAGVVEDKIKAKVSPLLDGLTIEKIEFSKSSEMYEIITPQGIFYTNKNGSHVIFGATVVDTTTKKNLTEEKLDSLSSFEFSKLPFANAIKTVKGDGSRKLATLEDPNCGYCKKFAQELESVDNVTIYTFITPILSSDSSDKARAVWCAPNRSIAWHDLMINGKTPVGDKDCAVPITKNMDLYKMLRAQGTPTLLFSDNTRAKGYLPADKLELRLKR